MGFFSDDCIRCGEKTSILFSDFLINITENDCDETKIVCNKCFHELKEQKRQKSIKRFDKKECEEK